MGKVSSNGRNNSNWTYGPNQFLLSRNQLTDLGTLRDSTPDRNLVTVRKKGLANVGLAFNLHRGSDLRAIKPRCDGIIVLDWIFHLAFHNVLSKTRRLRNLTLLVTDDGIQNGGKTEATSLQLIPFLQVHQFRQ